MEVRQKILDHQDLIKQQEENRKECARLTKMIHSNPDEYTKYLGDRLFGEEESVLDLLDVMDTHIVDQTEILEVILFQRPCLEAICGRFCTNDHKTSEWYIVLLPFSDKRIWIGLEKCHSAVKTCIQLFMIKGLFTIFEKDLYGINGRYHSFSKNYILLQCLDRNRTRMGDLYITGIVERGATCKSVYDSIVRIREKMVNGRGNGKKLEILNEWESHLKDIVCAKWKARKEKESNT